MLACNADGIALIKSFEGCILKSYLDQGGVWTIGWGHTGDDVSEGLVWTQDQADAAFLSDLHDKAEDPVNQLVKITINANQFSALCSLCYNIGWGRFARSGLLIAVNACNYSAVPTHIMARYTKSSGR